MRKTIVYMAVQVVERFGTGALKMWYDGEQRTTQEEAVEDAKNNALEFPGTPYQVIRREITEIGEEIRIKPKKEVKR